MWTVTLRQEIIDASGITVKAFTAINYSTGKHDLQMYWFKGVDGSAMYMNRNNILSIIETGKDVFNKTDY